MVSTRGYKYKFTDGERVLCYEPDPTKAKVLYDSKVLEVIVGKDERGRKNIEYLIHFQGWNSSWDRCVSEDYVLKDTEENRKLQRDLAEKAQLQLGAYLYRRERKKRARNLSQKVNEAWETGTNSCSSKKSQEEEEEEEEEEADEAEEDLLTTSDDDGESSIDTDDSLDERIPLDLSNHMKTLLEQDFDLINKHNKVVNLPATPNILEILEGYVKHCGASHMMRENNGQNHRRSRSHFQDSRETDPAKEFEAISARLNLCKEVADGLRIYFDFTLGQLLLYNSEHAQYQETRIGLKEYRRELPVIKMEPCDNLSEDDTSQNVSQSSVEMIADVKIEEHFETERKRSLRSHREPNLVNEASCSLQAAAVNAAVASASSAAAAAASNNGISKLTIRNLGSLGHVSTTALSNNHCSTMSTSSSSSYYSPLGGNLTSGSASSAITMSMSKLLDAHSSWKIAPDTYLDQKPPPPSSIYGAVHLARLFVKLPSLLYTANQPDKENQPRILPERKLKALIHHLQMFLTYLESKPEWFSERHYVDNKSTMEVN